ncbi:MAG: aminopeptidase P family protein [Bacteroidales bacterium]|nr:aminopeptidase P family protein [Bacteroidales bacterium]
MKTLYPDKNFYKDNRKALVTKMLSKSVLMISAGEMFPRSADQFFPFRANPNLYYLTGISQFETVLMLFPDSPNPEYREILFISDRDESKEIWNGKRLSKEEAQDVSGVKTVMWISTFQTVLRDAMLMAENVYLEYNEYSGYGGSDAFKNITFVQNIQQAFPLHHFYRAYPIIAELRAQKKETEINLLKKAIDITHFALERVMKTLVPGINEYEVEAEITYTFIKNNARFHGFQPIVASGINACYLHYHENISKCNKGDLLLIDIGGEYDSYTSDITRVFPVDGKFNKRQKVIYNAVLKVMKESNNLLVPGNTISFINEQSGLLMSDTLLEIGLLTKEDIKAAGPLAYKKFMPHGLSHFLGMDAHDAGNKFVTLKPGMILTCEPGIYIFDEKIGVRLENDLLITEKKPISLSAQIPIEIEEIEEIMSKKLIK